MNNKIKLSEDFLVTLHNDLVQARFSDSLTSSEQRILFSVLSNIEPPDFELNSDGIRVIKKPVKEIKPFVVPVKEFMEWLGITDPNYTKFKSTIKKLMKKLIEIQQEDGSWEVFQWVTKASYTAGTGLAEIKVSPELYPYLLNLDKNFTTTKLNVLLSFKCVYSSRLYQLIKKWEKIGSWKVEVEELKNLIGVPIKSEVKGVKVFKLTQYGHFKDKALNVAISEINTYTEFDVSFTEHKTVRKVTSLSFTIKKKKRKKKEPLESPQGTPKDVPGDSASKYMKNNGTDQEGYAESFLNTYLQEDRKFFDKITGEIVLFDDEERAKAIIINNKFEGLGNDACYRIEELLVQIINNPLIEISKEIHYLFSYTKDAQTINNPESFIISKLKTFVDAVLKGNNGIKMKSLINNKANNRTEVMPEWWFDGEVSKRVTERINQIEFEISRLGESTLTLKNAEHIETLISLSEGKEEVSISSTMKEDYEEYRLLELTGRLRDLMTIKKEELSKLGYLDSSGKVSKEILKEIYLSEPVA